MATSSRWAFRTCKPFISLKAGTILLFPCPLHSIQTAFSRPVKGFPRIELISLRCTVLVTASHCVEVATCTACALYQSCATWAISTICTYNHILVHVFRAIAEAVEITSQIIIAAELGITELG